MCCFSFAEYVSFVAPCFAARVDNLPLTEDAEYTYYYNSEDGSDDGLYYSPYGSPYGDDGSNDGLPPVFAPPEFNSCAGQDPSGTLNKCRLLVYSYLAILAASPALSLFVFFRVMRKETSEGDHVTRNFTGHPEPVFRPCWQLNRR